MIDKTSDYEKWWDNMSERKRRIYLGILEFDKENCAYRFSELAWWIQEKIKKIPLPDEFIERAYECGLEDGYNDGIDGGPFY